jgi:hypothetical protein
MEKGDLEMLVRYLRDLQVEPDVAERVSKVVQTVSELVRAVAADRLVFEDEPAAFHRALEKTKRP